jgi:hypothetical protein
MQTFFIYCQVPVGASLVQGASKQALQLWKLVYIYIYIYLFIYLFIYSEDMYSVLNCHNVANYAEFYLG